MVADALLFEGRTLTKWLSAASTITETTMTHPTATMATTGEDNVVGENDAPICDAPFPPLAESCEAQESSATSSFDPDFDDGGEPPPTGMVSPLLATNETENPGQVSRGPQATQMFALRLKTLPEPQRSIHAVPSADRASGGRQTSGMQSLSCCGTDVPRGCVVVGQPWKPCVHWAELVAPVEVVVVPFGQRVQAPEPGAGA